MALGMDNFDSVVFLQQFNKGYPMTIKDMTAAFYVTDPNKKGDGSDKIATIDCHNSKPANVGGIADTVGADDPTKCNHPAFSIKRYANGGYHACFMILIPVETWSISMRSMQPQTKYTLALYPLRMVIASSLHSPVIKFSQMKTSQ